MTPTIDVENEGMSDLDSSDSASNDENITANSYMQEIITKSALKISKSLSYINYRQKQNLNLNPNKFEYQGWRGKKILKNNVSVISK